MGDIIYLDHRHLARVLMGSQPLVWELLGGGIRSGLQMGCLNAGGRGRSLVYVPPVYEKYDRLMKIQREGLQSAPFRFSTASASMSQLLPSSVLGFLVLLFWGNKGSLTSILWPILGSPSNAASSGFTFQSLPHLSPGIISKE